jgi:secondary thiamine-phosphate synthase enzyme
MDTSVAVAPVGFLFSTIAVHTRRAREFVDITEDVHSRLRASGLRDGLLVVASRHTTAAIVVNEHEPELLKDLDRLLCEIAPEEQPYAHNGVPCGPGEHPNGHAHCQALLLSTSASIPIMSGSLALGRYQRIFLVELDHARPREVSVVLLGS